MRVTLVSIRLPDFGFRSSDELAFLINNPSRNVNYRACRDSF
jgi:hypothetical protein